MTEVAEAPRSGQEREIKRIGHWIGGRSVAGQSGRSGPVYNPATGEQTGAVDFASLEEIDAAIAAAKEAFPAWRADLALAPHRDVLPHPAARRRAPRGPRAAADGRAREGPLRRARRGAARARGDRVLLRHPRAAEGRLLRAGLDRDRRLLDPAAARRRRRDHAVQLPGDGAHVDVGAGARVRQHVRAQAVGEGPVGVAPHGGAAEGGRRPGRRVQRDPGRQGRRRPAARAPGRQRRSRSSARRRSRSTSTRPARPTTSASRRSAARRTT